MKPFYIAACAAIALGAATAYAATSASFHIPGATAKVEAMAGHKVEAFAFPPGTIKVITFDAGATAPYKITDEVQFVVLSGAVSTEVDGKAVDLAAGDAVNGPKGAIQPKAGAGQTTVVAHKVNSSVPASKPVVVRGADVAEGMMVQWMQDGKPQSASTEEAAKAAPATAGRFTVKRYVFDGNSIRVVSLKKGGRTNSTAYQTNNIIYMVKGQMKRNVGDVSAVVKAGDAVQEQSGTTGYWDILEDSQFVSTTALTAAP